MNFFFKLSCLLFLPLLLKAQTFQKLNDPNSTKKSKLSQTIEFDYQATERNRIYIYDTITNENDLRNKAGFNEVGQNFIFRSRTAYHHPFFTFLFEYVYSYRSMVYFNALEVEIKSQKEKISAHEITPYFFIHFAPLRIGLSQRFMINEAGTITREQFWSLKSFKALSFYANLYFASILNGPIGLGSAYEFSFNPTSKLPLKDKFRQKVSASFHLYFNYYVELKILLAMEQSFRKTTLIHYDNNNTLKQVELANLTRYLLEFLFTYNLTKELYLTVGIGKNIYSKYESPMARFRTSITYFFLRH